SEKDQFTRTLAIDGTNMQSRFDAVAYTAGAKFFPASWLMLRGSYATGDQLQIPNSLREFDPDVTTFAFGNDPKRGNTGIGQDASYLYLSGGSAALKPIHASTLFLGAVLMPSGEGGPSLGIDYSRIRETDGAQFLSVQDVLDHEDFWPGRVTRGPLTDADR